MMFLLLNHPRTDMLFFCITFCVNPFALTPRLTSPVTSQFCCIVSTLAVAVNIMPLSNITECIYTMTMHVFLHNVKSFHHLISDNEKNNNIDILPSSTKNRLTCGIKKHCVKKYHHGENSSVKSAALPKTIG